MSNYPSIKHQVIHSLKLFIKDVTAHTTEFWKKNKKYENLIVPKNKKFLEFFNFEPDEKYLNCVFEREKKDYK